MINEGKKIYDFIKKTQKKNNKKMSTEKKSNKEVQADNIIRNHVIWSMGAGFIPVLVADIFAVSALQLDMIRQMSRVYDIDFQETQGKAVVTSLTSTTLARLGAGSIVKLIPGLGSLVGGATVSAFAGASTYALGEVFKHHFASGGTILDFDPDRLRKYYKDKFEKGKTVAKEWKAEQEDAGSPDFKINTGEDVPTASAQGDKEKAATSTKEKKASPKKEAATTKATKTTKKATTAEVKDTPPAPKVASVTDDIVEKLKKLAELKEAGIITEDEFKQMKQRILDKF